MSEKFEIKEYPNKGRLARYSKELETLEEANNNEGILDFCKRLFLDCKEYLKTVFGLSFPDICLSFVNHRDFSELANKLDAKFGAIPRHGAMIVGYSKAPPVVYIDMPYHFEGNTPLATVTNLCVSLIEELIHASDHTKNETQIQEIVCSAIEGFLEIKLPNSAREYRLKYSKTCDEAKKNDTLFS